MAITNIEKARSIVEKSRYKSLLDDPTIAEYLGDLFDVFDCLQSGLSGTDEEIFKKTGKQLQIKDGEITDTDIEVAKRYRISQISSITISDNIQTLHFSDGKKYSLSNREASAGEFRCDTLRLALEKKRLTNSKTTLFDFFVDVFKDVEKNPKSSRYMAAVRGNLYLVLRQTCSDNDAQKIANSLVNDAYKAYFPKSFLTKLKTIFSNLFFKLKSFFVNYKIPVRLETAETSDASIPSGVQNSDKADQTRRPPYSFTPRVVPVRPETELNPIEYPTLGTGKPKRLR